MLLSSEDVKTLGRQPLRRPPWHPAGMSKPVDLAAVLSQIDQPWRPVTVAVLNDYDLRVVKIMGEFTRHSHPETDEAFIVLKGSMIIRLDAGDVTLTAGQLHVVPRGVTHQPVSLQGAEVLLIEPSTTINTGDTPSPLTTESRRL
jgi:mannose-6-phosphate isomerase-like protein (cupin superfamily)